MYKTLQIELKGRKSGWRMQRIKEKTGEGEKDRRI